MRALALAAVAAAVFLGVLATPRPAKAIYCYYICSLYKEGECVEHRQGCMATAGDRRAGGARARTYGAIAFSPATHRNGYSDHFGTEAAASARAMAGCGQPDCRVVVWFYDSCGALATGGGTVWGAAHGPVARASAAALGFCRAQGGGPACRVVLTHCSG